MTTNDTGRHRYSCTRREGRHSHRKVHAASPGARIQDVPGRDREKRTVRSRHSYRHGQRVHSQDQVDPRLVRQKAPSSREEEGGGTLTLPRPPHHGSIRSNASSACLPTSKSDGVHTDPPKSWKRPSWPTSTSATQNPNLSDGQSQQTASCQPSSASANGHSMYRTSVNRNLRIGTLVAGYAFFNLGQQLFYMCLPSFRRS